MGMGYTPRCRLGLVPVGQRGYRDLASRPSTMELPEVSEEERGSVASMHLVTLLFFWPSTSSIYQSDTPNLELSVMGQWS